jgi:hypothetical protein
MKGTVTAHEYTPKTRRAQLCPSMSYCCLDLTAVWLTSCSSTLCTELDTHVCAAKNINPSLERAGFRAAGEVRHLLQVLNRDEREASRSSRPHTLSRGPGGSSGQVLWRKVVAEVPRAILVAISIHVADITSHDGGTAHIVTVSDEDAS